MSERTGKVLWHLTMSLDGFIAGPNHEMGWMAGFDFTPGLVDRYVAGTGAILAGRRGFDAGVDADPTFAAPYGGAWSGPMFVLTHHPEDATPHEGMVFIDCDIVEAVQTALGAAGGKDLEVFGADLARQCLERGLIDEFHVHLAPVMLGDGLRFLHARGIDPCVGSASWRPTRVRRCWTCATGPSERQRSTVGLPGCLTGRRGRPSGQLTPGPPEPTDGPRACECRPRPPARSSTPGAMVHAVPDGALDSARRIDLARRGS